MDISNELMRKLNKLGINPESLSDNEIRYLTQINNVYEEFKKKNDELVDQINRNKFNKMVVSKRVDCSRQTLYKNPTLTLFLNYCLSESEKVSNVMPNDCVSREKYQLLKEENANLLINIVKDAQKDAEIERLTKELNEKERRIQNLLHQMEQDHRDLQEFRIKEKQKNILN